MVGVGYDGGCGIGDGGCGIGDGGCGIGDGGCGIGDGGFGICDGGCMDKHSLLAEEVSSFFINM